MKIVSFMVASWKFSLVHLGLIKHTGFACDPKTSHSTATSETGQMGK